MATAYVTDATSEEDRQKWMGRIGASFPVADTIAVGETYTRMDLPAGAGRLYADAIGVSHVFVVHTEIPAGSASFMSLKSTLTRVRFMRRSAARRSWGSSTAADRTWPTSRTGCSTPPTAATWR